MHKHSLRTLFVLSGMALAAGLLSGCILAYEPTPLPLTATVRVTVVPNTATVLPTIIVPSKTALATLTPIASPTNTSIPTKTATSAPSPTNTSVPTKTATSKPSPTATFTLTPTALPYSLQPGTPAYIKNFAYPAKGCNWIGAAGQVFGADGKPQLNLVVVVKGVYGGKPIEMIGVSGTIAGDIYGPGGFEVQIGSTPLPTKGQLSIQVFDLEGNPLTDAVVFDTYSDCGRNLIIVNFSR